MGELFTRAAWTLFAVGAGAVATTGGAWVVLAVAIVLGVVGGASQDRRVQRRVPFFRTERQRLAEFYASALKLRTGLKPLAREHRAAGWEEWRDRIAEWDSVFWPYIQRSRDDWQLLRRTVSNRLTKGYVNWADVGVRMMDERLAVIERLMGEAAR